jgi:hypothetical protein
MRTQERVAQRLQEQVASKEPHPSPHEHDDGHEMTSDALKDEGLEQASLPRGVALGETRRIGC